jgi:hypothetical protein
MKLKKKNHDSSHNVSKVSRNLMHMIDSLPKGIKMNQKNNLVTLKKNMKMQNALRPILLDPHMREVHFFLHTCVS